MARWAASSLLHLAHGNGAGLYLAAASSTTVEAAEDDDDEDDDDEVGDGRESIFKGQISDYTEE